MKEGWLKQNIGEIAAFSQGIQVGLKHHKYNPSKGYVRFIRIVDYTQDTDDIRYVKDPGEKYYVTEDDIVMVRYGTPGLIGRGKSGVIANNLFKISINNEGISNDYLSLYLSQSHIQKYLSTQGSSTMPALTFGQLKKVEINYPKSIGEQKAIVKILDEAFAKIDQAKANIEKNIENAKELFQSKLNEIFSQRGEGWEEGPIEKLTEVVTKGSSPKWQGISYTELPGILFVTSENVGEGKLKMKKTKYVEKRFNEIQKKSILKYGDVLTNIVGASIGRTAIYDLDEIANINQAVCIMRCKKDLLYNKFLMYMLNSPYFKTILHDNEVDNARANLSLTFFKNLTIPLPDLMAQKEIVEEIVKLEEQTNLLLHNFSLKLANVVNLKKSLLQKAFAGELTKMSEP